MKREAGLVQKCLLGALLSSVAWAVPGVQALAADQLPVKAPAAVEAIPYWWWHGEVDVGGRFFLNDPPRSGFSYLGQPSLAKFYEYRDLRPGPIGNFWISTGSKDGLYQIDIGGKNVGYDDQYYYLEASKAGQHYFNFEWDQTPHVLSTGALTFYQGLGTSVLTRPWATLAYSTAAAGQTGILPFLYQTDLGFRRDTAAATYRWTPSDPWDIRADYSHMSRSGTQVDGIVGFGNIGGGGSSAVQVPKPVDDTTQNYGLNGEYSGAAPWGKKLTVKLAYNGSTYTDNLSSYLVQNPYTTAPSAGQSPFARMSLWPSNQMNAVGGTAAAELPWNSRYAGVLNYTMMRQNDAFQPMSFLAPTFPLPASSLNGAVNTLLSNNVITTQITPELQNKAFYRYFNYDNQTPQLAFLCRPPLSPTCNGITGNNTGIGSAWLSLDRAGGPVPGTGQGNESAIQALVLSYTKQNIGDELVWRPSREWTLGAAYGFERYDWTNYIASATNENSAKVFVDWKPTSWFTLRSSGYYANRRADDYNLLAFTNNQFPTGNLNNGFQFQPAYRMLMVDNRERWKANVFMDIVVVPGLTVTPNFKYQDDYYGLNSANQMGLTDARSWDAGIDATYVINPRASIMVGYTRDFLTQLAFGNTSTSQVAPVGGANLALTNDRITIDTFVALVRYSVIPDKLDTEFRYSASHGVDTQNLFDGTPPQPVQFPDVTSWWQRFDAVATYTFDRSQVAALGWKGEAKAKLHYAWERNSVANWQQDPLMPIGNTGLPTLIFTSYDNPNYNVHLLSAALAFKW